MCVRVARQAWSSGPSTSPLDSVYTLLRTSLAFALSPVLGVIAASLVSALITQRSVDIGLAASLLPIAYLVAGVIGLPAFLLSRAWLPIPIWSYATVGLIAACFVSIPIMAFFGAFAWGSLVFSRERPLDSHLG
jgi:hypothetical protein